MTADTSTSTADVAPATARPPARQRLARPALGTVRRHPDRPGAPAVGLLAAGHRRRHAVRGVPRRVPDPTGTNTTRSAVRRGVDVHRDGLDDPAHATWLRRGRVDLHVVPHRGGRDRADRPVAGHRPTARTHARRGVAPVVPVRRRSARHHGHRAGGRPARGYRPSRRGDPAHVGGVPDRIRPCRPGPRDPRVRPPNATRSRRSTTWSVRFARRRGRHRTLRSRAAGHERPARRSMWLRCRAAGRKAHRRWRCHRPWSRNVTWKPLARSRRAYHSISSSGRRTRSTSTTSGRPRNARTSRRPKHSS